MNSKDDFITDFFNIAKLNQTDEQRKCKHLLASQMKDQKWFCPSCKLVSEVKP